MGHIDHCHRYYNCPPHYFDNKFNSNDRIDKLVGYVYSYPKEGKWSVKDSVWTWYYDTGEIFLIGEFNKNIKTGKWISFNKDGSKIDSVMFLNNKSKN